MVTCAGTVDDLPAGTYVATVTVVIDDPAAGTPEDETVFEALYKVQLTPAISIKPELQYISHAGGGAGADDVLVGLVRFEFLF